jgi:Cys-tRNA(Pro)/Cys-tRNA(Cys) deacylase
MARGKTNAARRLDSLRITYTLMPYRLDEADLSAEHIAVINDFDVSRLFKTLVLQGDKTGVIIACLSGDAELNLKALASASGNKKVEMVPLKDIQALTGYIRGGVSPIGLKKPYPVYLDESALKYPTIMVNAGHKGLLLELNPIDLMEAVGAYPVSLIQK